MFYKSMKQRWLHGLIIAALATGIIGCSDNNDRQAVKGTVTLDGKPMASGTIDFKPIDANNAGTSGATINDQGQFVIPANKGLVPGQYRVNIQLWEETNRTFFDPTQEKQVKITAPAQYKESNQLEATIIDGDNKFQFELTRVR